MKLSKIVGIVVMSLLSTLIYAKTINPKNISKNNISLDKKAKAICKEKYKGKYQVPGTLIFCADKITKKWEDEGLYEGTHDYNVKHYKHMSSDNLFQSLSSLVALERTARKSEDIDSSDYIEGELYQSNYVQAIVFIINELLERRYKPIWNKTKQSQRVKEFWHSVVVSNIIHNGG